MVFHTARSALAVLVLLTAAVSSAHGSDVILVRPRPGDRFPMRAGRVDHSAFDALLARYVDAKGQVDYAAWKRNGRAALQRYLEQMAAAHPAAFADQNERKAYWINVYNALTIHGMLRFYPTRSIRDHVSHFFGFHFWKDVRIEVEGRSRSLDAIEHELLRPMGDARIHFAINCASKGCPPLRNEAYRGETLDRQLDDNCRRAFSRPRWLRLDRARKTVSLCRVMDWFGEDFGDDTDKIDFAARYAPPPAAAWIRAHKSELDIEYLPYDWSINDRPNAR